MPRLALEPPLDEAVVIKVADGVPLGDSPDEPPDASDAPLLARMPADFR